MKDVIQERTGSWVAISTPSSTLEHSRILGLDVMRALAIALVLTCHFLVSIPADERLHGASFVASLCGLWGVEVFFVLSGFLIGQILFKEYFLGRHFGLSQLSFFWKRRWYRTLPTYYLALLICTLLSLRVSHSPPIEYRSYLLFAQNVLYPDTRLMGVSWSLAIEEWFYVLFPLLLYLCTTRSDDQPCFGGRRRSALVAITLYAVLALFGKWVVAIYNPNPSQLRETLLFRLDAILYGVAAAWFKLNSETQWRIQAHKLLAMGSLLVTCNSCIWLGQHTASSRPVLEHAIGLGLGGAGIALMLPYMDSLRSIRPSLDGPVTHVSCISYSLYLFHGWCLVLARKGLQYMDVQWGSPVSFVCYISLCVLICSATYRFYERPTTNLRGEPH